MENKNIFKIVGFVVITLISIYFIAECIGYNTSGYRTVIESRTGNGKLEVKFNSGFYYTFFGKTKEYPDVMTVSFTKEGGTTSSIDINPITIRFNDATSATSEGVVKFMLPKDEDKMIRLHKDYRSVENLGLTGFKPFVMECLKNSAQLMSSEMHYLGGRSTMSQNFQNQLEDGVLILITEEKVIRDTIENENKRVYSTRIATENGKPVRKKSMLEQYNVTVIDAVISDVDYEERVDKLLGLKIDATSKTSISKQELMRAQQEALTAKAQGEKTLVETEYKELQNQKTQVIQAQTEVELAKQNKMKEQTSYEASKFTAARMKELAEAEAYGKKVVMIADGALEKRINGFVEVNKAYAAAMGNQPIVPETYFGGSNGTGSVPNSSTFIDLMIMKTAKDFSLDYGVKK